MVRCGKCGKELKCGCEDSVELSALLILGVFLVIVGVSITVTSLLQHKTVPWVQYKVHSGAKASFEELVEGTQWEITDVALLTIDRKGTFYKLYVQADNEHTGCWANDFALVTKNGTIINTDLVEDMVFWDEHNTSIYCYGGVE